MPKLTQAAINKILRDGRRERYLRYKADGWNLVRWIAIDEACLADHGRIYDIRDSQWPEVLKKHNACRCRFVVLIQEKTNDEPL